MKIKYNHFLILIMVVSVLSSCKGKKEKAIMIPSLKNPIKSMIGKKLFISKNLSMYSPFSNSILEDSTEISNSKFKIYYYIDVSCVTCLEEIKLWDSLAIEFSKYKTPVILICGTKDDFEFIKYLCESKEIKNFPYPFFLDNDGEYNRQNEFRDGKSHINAVLTNKENVILLFGNPLYSKEIKELYIKEIRKN